MIFSYCKNKKVVGKFFYFTDSGFSFCWSKIDPDYTKFHVVVDNVSCMKSWITGILYMYFKLLNFYDMVMERYKIFVLRKNEETLWNDFSMFYGNLPMHWEFPSETSTVLYVKSLFILWSCSQKLLAFVWLLI